MFQIFVCALLLSGVVIPFADDVDLHMEKFEIKNNEWLDANAAGTVNAAISLTKSSAAITYNTIEGDDYKYGLMISGATGSEMRPTNSLLCSNQISDQTTTGGAGIYADNWIGYGKLNVLSNNVRGAVAGVHNRGFLIFNTITGNSGPGLEVSHGYGLWDLSGVHDPSDDDPDYSAKNTIHDNNEEGISAQILVGGTNLSTTLHLGQVHSWYNNYAKNSIYAGAVTDQDLISGVANANPDIPIGAIDENFWGGIDPSTDASKFPEVTYSCTTVLDEEQTYNVICGDGFELSQGSKGKRISSQSMKEFNSCNESYGRGSGLIQFKEYQRGYDTLKHMVETCAPNNHWPYAQMAFYDMGGAVVYMSTDASRFLRHREWLKSVLYLNTINPVYYCQAVAGILRTYNWTGINGGRDINSMVSIVRYILANSKCDFERQDWIITDSSLRAIQKSQWLLNKPDLDGLDTTLPTIEDLDLTILYGPFGSVGPASKFAKGSLTNVHASRNPFTSSTEIEYTLSGLAQVEVSLFNSLGQEIWKQEAGGVLDEGTHRLTVDGTSLPTGTLYLRVSTIEGDVKTVKLIHE